MPDPQSTGQWLQLARQHEVTARAMCENKIAASQACFHAGLAVECALKAYIMKIERLDGWPSRDARPELYVHDLRRLAQIAGIRTRATDATAAFWIMFFRWDRIQGYDPKSMPRKAARGWVEAAFGPSGIVTWLRGICR